MTSILVSCTSAPKAKQSPTVESVLKRMARSYHSLKSYSDSGEVYDYRNGVRDAASKSFRIHFVRPDRLRFEMVDNIGSPYFPQDYQVLWSSGEATYTWWQSYPQIQTCRDARDAVAQFTGISLRSAHNIPSLFQANFGWQEYLSQISSPKILGEEGFEGIDCYRIQGGGRGGREFELWIGKSDHLIRKIQTTYSGSSTEEIHRGIMINQPISPEQLTFMPPLSPESQKKNVSN